MTDSFLICNEPPPLNDDSEEENSESLAVGNFKLNGLALDASPVKSKSDQSETDEPVKITKPDYSENVKVVNEEEFLESDERVTINEADNNFEFNEIVKSPEIEHSSSIETEEIIEPTKSNNNEAVNIPQEFSETDEAVVQLSDNSDSEKITQPENVENNNESLTSDEEFDDYLKADEPVESLTPKKESDERVEIVQQSINSESVELVQSVQPNLNTNESPEKCTEVDDEDDDFDDFQTAPISSQPPPPSNNTSSSLQELPDDDFANFQSNTTWTTTATPTPVQEKPQLESLIKSVFLLQQQQESICGNNHSTDDEEIKSLEKGNDNVGNHVQDFEASQCLIFKWLNSNSYTHLLKSLNIDSTMIMYGVEIPRFAASIVQSPLRPEPLSSSQQNCSSSSSIGNSISNLGDSNKNPPPRDDNDNETQRILQQLPDLSFMRAKTLVFYAESSSTTST